MPLPAIGANAFTALSAPFPARPKAVSSKRPVRKALDGEVGQSVSVMDVPSFSPWLSDRHRPTKGILCEKKLSAFIGLSDDVPAKDIEMSVAGISKCG